jgi:hypothetical protein
VGPWFNLQETSDFSDKRKSEIEAARRAGKLSKKITVRKRTTIEDLLDDWSKAAADAIERTSIGDSFYLGLFTGQRQTDRLIMRNESCVEGRHAFRQSKTGELVDIKEATPLSAR